MVVIKLVDHVNKETVAVLRCMLDAALKGELAGIAACAKFKGGHERAFFTGAYRSRPSEAAAAAMRLSMKLTQALDSTLA